MNRFGHSHKRWLALLALGAVLLTVGCAEERKPINRVQPFSLKKTFFLGKDLRDPADNPEFWSQGTLIDVGSGASQDGLFTSTYAQPLTRIKWDVTEDLLIARLAYERVEGYDGKGIGKETPDGTVVAAYRIEKHFDVAREYNATTGEQLNILDENASDRPWYEREYMRVDWSKNLSVDNFDYDTLSLLGLYGGVTYTPLAYDVSDPQDPNAPYLADLENGYFDVTNRAFAQPEMINFPQWGISMPSCMLDADFGGGSAPIGSCSPVELTIRQAFRKVVDSDYEPVDWDGYRFQAFGMFTVDRHGFSRNYGPIDDKWRRFATRYNIWERSHAYGDPAKMTDPVSCYTEGDLATFGAASFVDQNNNGTDDRCESVGPGSRCDLFRHQCTLPFAERTPLTIPWYYTDGGDAAYFEPTAQAAHEWDVALRVAIRTAQYTECQTTGQSDCLSKFPVYFGQQDDNQDAIALSWDVDQCREQKAWEGEDCEALAERLAVDRGLSAELISIAKMPQMIVLCHSPVEAGDPQACGKKRLPEGVSSFDCAEARKTQFSSELLDTCAAAIHARRGDLRYHLINVIEEPQDSSPWGIYTDAEDPVTGEKVSAAINVWTYINDLWSQGVVDQVRYLKGVLKTEDVTEGQYVKDWAQVHQASTKGGLVPGLDRQELADRLASFTQGSRTDALRSLDKDPQALPEPLSASDRDLIKKFQKISASLDAPSATRALYNARSRQVAGTPFEAALITPMIQQLNNLKGKPMSDNVLEMISPLRGGNPSFRRELQLKKEIALGHRGACILHPQEAAAPLSLTALSSVLERKFGAFDLQQSASSQTGLSERMRQYLARKVHYSVISHEMGHSIGLRHNFVSSSDAFNYRPQYWQLRTKNGKVTTGCTDLVADGASCVGPRYFDPVTPEESDNLIWMFMNSSTMEYAGEATQDLLGLGVYDFAATRMLYGDTVAVHNDKTYKGDQLRGMGVVSKINSGFGGILGISPMYGFSEIHYSALQKYYKLIRDDTCKTVDPTLFTPGDWDEEKNGQWDPLLDGLIVKVDGQYSRCKQQDVDYVSWNSMQPPKDPADAATLDKKGRTRVPYGFGTDDWADLGNLSVYRHDNGADPYEIFNFMITQQEVNLIFDTYRRHRDGFSVRRASDRILNRYNAKLRDGAKGLGLYRNIYQEVALQEGKDFASYWPYFANRALRDNILASSVAFDHIARTFSRPEAGPHFLPAGDNVLRSTNDVFVTVGSGDIQVVVPNGASGFQTDVGVGGKLVENQLSSNHGEYDRDYVLNAGSYYDKVNATMLMTESVDNFMSSSRTDFVDPRYRAVSLADLFPDGFRRFLSNNLTGDDFLKGPRLAADATGKPLVDPTSKFPTSPIGWTSWWRATPEICFPSQGTTSCSDFVTATPNPLKPNLPASTAVLDPQVGFEQMKFLIVWTLYFLPENMKTYWIDMMRLWEKGVEADPGFAKRVEFHSPAGKVYVAKSFGKETIFGKVVEKGIAARVLQYANELLAAAYETDPTTDANGDAILLPRMRADGTPIVKYDPSVKYVGTSGSTATANPTCNGTDNSGCTCAANRACVTLERYLSIPAYLREAMSAFGMAPPYERGVF